MSGGSSNAATEAVVVNGGAPELGDGEDTGPRLFKFVLTGGPCGGKTTALARLQDFFRTNGGWW